MAEIIRGTNIADPIVPYTTADNIPTHYAKYGKGGFRTVNTFSELGQIPEMRLEPGMAVFVIDEQKTYQYLRISKPDEEPAVYDWKKGKLGGGGVEVVENWTELDESEKLDLEEDGTIIYVVNGEEQDPTGKRNIYPDQFFYFANGSWIEYGQIYVGPYEPRNKSVIWVDTNDRRYDESNEILYSVQRALVRLQEQVSSLMTLKTNGVIAGTPENNVREEIAYSVPAVKPYYKIQAEAETFKDLFFSDGVIDGNLLEEDLSLINSVSGLLNEFSIIQSFLEICGNEPSDHEKVVGDEVFLLSMREFVSQTITEALTKQENHLFSLYEEFAPGFHDIFVELVNADYRGLIGYLEILAESSEGAQKFLADIENYRLSHLTTESFLQNYVEVILGTEIGGLSDTVTRLNILQSYITLYPWTGEAVVNKVKESSTIEIYSGYIPGYKTLLDKCTDDLRIIVGSAKLLLREEYDSSVDEIEPDTSLEPTVKHISIKMGNYSQLESNKKNFIPGELMWCTDRAKLYIYINGTLTEISGSGGSSDGGGNNGDDMTNEEIKNAILEQLGQVESIGFIPVGSETPKYTAKVNEEGKFIVYENSLDKIQEIKNGYQFDESVNVEGVVINSLYLGGNGDEHSYLPCSHNFIELSNVWVDKNGKGKDISLNGFFLCYKSADFGDWEILPLWGKIPAGGTFLIRGAQCSVMDVNTTVIKVKTYDMEWYVTKSTGSGDNIQTHKELISFSTNKPAFYLCCGKYVDDAGGKWLFGDSLTDNDSFSEGIPTSGLIYIDKNVVTNSKVVSGYIDLVGLFKDNPLCENKPYQLKNKEITVQDVIFKRWYQLDPVTQSNPASIDKRNNVKYLTASYLSGSNMDTGMLQALTPKASWEGKSIATDKTLFSEAFPSTLTCTFGIQATDNTVVSNKEGKVTPEGPGATRCFCWNSVGYYDEGIKIKSIERDEEIEIESIKDNGYTVPSANFITPGIDYSDITEDYLEYYNRIRWESSYGQAITTHRVIVRGLKAGEYEYRVYRKGDENYTNRYNTARKFTIRTDKDVVENGFNFIQTTDQQGANWEEYEVWNLSAKVIRRENDRWDNEGWDNKKQITSIEDIDNNDINSIVLDQNRLNFYQVNIELSSISDPGQPYTTINDGDTIKVGNTYWQVDETVTSKLVFIGTTYSESFTEAAIGSFMKLGDSYRQVNYSLVLYTQAPSVPNYDFTINTGDICYNGSRSNEWIDYFYGYEPLNDKVEMLTIGNNDLAPVSMIDLGNGKETPWKINVGVIDYFYTYEIDPINPQIFIGTSSVDNSSRVKYKIPSLYSFNYGDYHFLSLLSEVRTLSNKVEYDDNGEITSEGDIRTKNTVSLIFGIVDEERFLPNGTKVTTASAIFDRIEEWVTRDLIKWKKGSEDYITYKNANWGLAEYVPSGGAKNPIWPYRIEERYNSSIKKSCGKCIVYTHEMPFNIISDSSYGHYISGHEVPRETAKAYLNRFHNYEFQRLFELWGVRLVMGGHKHTAAMTLPVFDAPDNYNPIIGSSYDSSTETENGVMVNTGPNESFPLRTTFNPFVQILAEDFDGYWGNNRDYCKDVYNNSNNYRGELINEFDSESYYLNSSVTNPRIRIEIVDEITAPNYIMCQATGFKNKSNSDLAASVQGEIPWEKFYVKGDDTNVVGQCYPFYTSYRISPKDRIGVDMYRIINMYGGTDTTDQARSKAGYWDLTGIYSPLLSLEENRERVVENCTLGSFNNNNSIIIKTGLMR